MLSSTLSLSSAPGSMFGEWILRATEIIEALAVVIILFGVVYATALFLYKVFVRRSGTVRPDVEYKQRVGKALLLGLELLLAADVVYTVTLDLTLSSIATLGLLVLVRTFLGWSLVVEIDGRWPWQPERNEEKGAE